VPGYAQYVAESRATGTYFCPDHFAGLMELACAMGAGLLLAGPRRAAWRLWGAGLVAMGILGVVLSKSRGGGLTLLVMAAAAVAWGFSAWRPERRRLLQGITAAAVLLAVIVAWNLDPAYVRRFKTYFGLHETRTRSLPEIAAELRPRLRDTSRGRMIPAALRAWKTSPWLGVGPGMHQNIWPHVAATPDGDRERGILPSQLNDTFHSYEAHSDWVQLLEEYGLAGLALFLVPVGLGFAVLLRERPRRRTRRTADALRDAALFGALLAAVAMSFHSLGDFNLQIPATAWLLAMLVALPLGGGFRRAQQTVAA
jgi:O-antigen ligase